MKKQTLIFITLIFTTYIQTCQVEYLRSGAVTLKADNGQYLTLCNNCGKGAYPDSASLSSTPQSWTLDLVKEQISLKGSNGKFLSRCNNCWYSGAAYVDSAFVHLTDYYPYTVWTPKKLSNGKYTFKSDNGKYLARCNNCVYGNSRPNFAFVHETNPDKPWAQWEITYNEPVKACPVEPPKPTPQPSIPPIKTCPVEIPVTPQPQPQPQPQVPVICQADLPIVGVRTFQADNGQYLKYGPQCGNLNAVTTGVGNDAFGLWNISSVGDKVIIKGPNGNYLSKCTNCWLGSPYLDSALLLCSPTISESLWTPRQLSNRKWVFQSSTGKYLSRCQKCAVSTCNSLGFIEGANPDDPQTQWIIA